MLRGSVGFWKEDGLHPNSPSLWSSATFLLGSLGRGVRLDLAQSILQQGCAHTDKLLWGRESLVCVLSLERWLFISRLPDRPKAFTKFCLMLSQDLYESTRLKSLARWRSIVISAQTGNDRHGISWEILFYCWTISILPVIDWRIQWVQGQFPSLGDVSNSLE